MLSSNGYVLDQSPARFGQLQPVSAQERSDRDRLWHRLRRHGYLYLPGFLDRQVVLDFRAYYFETLANVGLLAPDSDPVEGCDSGGVVDLAALREALFSHVVPGPAYAEFCSQERIVRWFEWLYASSAFLHRRKILRHIRPGENGIGTATQAHYDLVYLREGTDRVLSMWIPLGDVPLEQGPLIYLEGSHLTYAAEEAAGTKLAATSMTADLPGLANAHAARWLATEFRAGDVMIHSPYIVHASLDNASGSRLRLSTDIRYQRAGDPIDWRWQRDWRDDDGL